VGAVVLPQVGECVRLYYRVCHNFTERERELVEAVQVKTGCNPYSPPPQQKKRVRGDMRKEGGLNILIGFGKGYWHS